MASHVMTLAESAALVRRDERTLRRWAKKIDITDPEQLLAYAKTMDARSKGRTKTLALARLSDSETIPSDSLAELPPPGETGAAAALKRLEALEVKFAQRLERSLAGDDVALVQVARADYTQIANALRQYEREVEEAKRDLGQLIPKSDAIDGARASAMWLRLTVWSFVSSFLPDLIAFNEPRAAKAFFIEKFCETLRVTFMNARESTLKLPEWCEAVIREEFQVE